MVHRVSVAYLGGKSQGSNSPNEAPKVAGPLHYYHTKRSHRGLDYRTPKQVETGEEAEPVETLSIADLRLRESLGGTLKWYEPKAA